MSHYAAGGELWLEAKYLARFEWLGEEMGYFLKKVQVTSTGQFGLTGLPSPMPVRLMRKLGSEEVQAIEAAARRGEDYEHLLCGGGEVPR